jgi:hypothetical protein
MCGTWVANGLDAVWSQFVAQIILQVAAIIDQIASIILRQAMKKFQSRFKEFWKKLVSQFIVALQ